MHYNERNPHPFSTRKTELIWDGKYDERGKRRTLDITAATLPLQLIEAIPHARFANAPTGAKPLNGMRPVHSFQIFCRPPLCSASSPNLVPMAFRRTPPTAMLRLFP